jgi:hypothetical protein
VAWPDEAETEQQNERDPALEDPHPRTWAAGRPLAWLYDEITNKDRARVSAHHPAPALLLRINPSSGITETDYRVLLEWPRSIDPTPPSSAS